jgi:hypothetical protein
MVPGLNLEQRRANAVRRAYEEKVQDIAFFGDSSTGLPGFFNSTFVDSATASKWFTDPTITTNEMLQLLNAGPTNIVNNSNMRETPDTILMPYTAYKVISTTPRSDVSDTTVMEFFLRTNPYITSIEPINQLDSTKAITRLGWHPVWSFERALNHTAGWYRRWLEGGQVASVDQLAACGGELGAADAIVVVGIKVIEEDVVLINETIASDVLVR